MGKVACDSAILFLIDETDNIFHVLAQPVDLHVALYLEGLALIDHTGGDTLYFSGELLQLLILITTIVAN
jgi:hypothetical protein